MFIAVWTLPLISEPSFGRWGVVRATGLSICIPTTPENSVRVCVRARAPAMIFKTRTKYVIIPILGDELSYSKTEGKKVRIKISLKFFFVFEVHF